MVNNKFLLNVNLVCYDENKSPINGVE